MARASVEAHLGFSPGADNEISPERHVSLDFRQQQLGQRERKIRKALKDALNVQNNGDKQINLDFGRLQMKQSVFDTSEFCRMQLKAEDEQKTEEQKTEEKKLRGEMMCFIAEKVWGLERPDLLVTVTGGATDFSLTTENEHELLTGVIAASQEMKVWFVSGGSDSGIMKYIGDARAKYAAHVPLIGIAPWGIVQGRSLLTSPSSPYTQEVQKYLDRDLEWFRPTEASLDGVDIRKASLRKANLAEKPSVAMNQHHSHFFFVETPQEAGEPFGKEIASRSLFEEAITGSYFFDSTKGMVESICIVVQGGVGTVDTVAGAVDHFTPVFLVKGSGNCADLCADICIVQAEPESPLHRPQVRWTKRMKEMGKLLSEHGRKKRAASLSQRQADASLLEEEEEGWPLEQLKAVWKDYFPSAKEPPNLRAVWNKAYNAAMSQMCWVFDLDEDNKQKLDLSGSMLRCILNGINLKVKRKLALSTAEAAKNIEESGFRERMQLCLHWDRPDILEHCINYKHAHLTNTSNEFKDAVTEMLQPALLDNRVAAMEMLLYFKADLAAYQIPYKKDQVSDTNAPRMASWWAELFVLLYRDQSSPHKRAADTQQPPPEENPGLEDMIEFSEVVKNSLDEVKGTLERSASDKQLGNASPLSLGRLKPANGNSNRESNTISSNTVIRSCVQADNKFKADWHVGLNGGVWSFEKDVRELLGSKCRYMMGREGAAMDLLMWSVMMGRKELSEAIWLQTDKPITSALTACILYRKLAAQPGHEPSVRARMKAGGDMFEMYAIGVTKVAAAQSLVQTLDVLEERSGMWEGVTAVDMAMEGECEEFMEECLTEAIVRRFRGDISSHYQRWALLGLEGYLTVVCCCLLTFGFAAPLVLIYNPPPIADNVRFSSQRRNVPKGYPFDLADNDEMRLHLTRTDTRAVRDGGGHGQHGSQQAEGSDDQIKGKPTTRGRRASLLAEHNGKSRLSGESNGGEWAKLLRSPQKGWTMGTAETGRMGPEELNRLWAPTFAYWERFALFWRSPAVLFLASSILQGALTIAFTVWLIMKLPSDHSMEAMEYVMLVYFCAYLFAEAFQLLFTGAGYFFEFWNLIDLFASLSFMSAFVVRRHYAHIDGFIYADSVRLEHLWFFLYSLTSGGLWARLLRVLSIDKQLGILVITFKTMTIDIVRFGLIWVLLWMGFAVVMRGAAMNEERWNFKLEECVAEGEARRAKTAGEGGAGVDCWYTWWVVRLFFQSMGEFFLEEVDTDAELAVLVVCFVTMNVILLNLLIAIMSNTYAEVMAKANRTYLNDRYSLSLEVSRVALAFPPPFNIPYTLVELIYFVMLESNGRSKLIYGLEDWKERLAAHFRRSQGESSEFPRILHNKLRDTKDSREDITTDTQWQAMFDDYQDKDAKELKRRYRVQGEAERLRDAFVERAREKFMQQYRVEQGKDEQVPQLETKTLKAVGGLERHVMGAVGELKDQVAALKEQARHSQTQNDALLKALRGQALAETRVSGIGPGEVEVYTDVM